MTEETFIVTEKILKDLFVGMTVEIKKCPRHPNHGTRVQYNQVLCRGCNQQITSIKGKTTGAQGNNYIKKVRAKSASLEANQKSEEKKRARSIEQLAQPYIDVGLAKPFAMAIARGTKIEDVMALWESKWWKQYDPEDILICSVLDGTITENEGKWLNTVRSDHEDLTLACIRGECTMDWAKALMKAGFKGQQTAVKAALDGGIPELIARIQRFEVEKKLLPPALVDAQTRKKAQAEAQKSTTTRFVVPMDWFEGKNHSQRKMYARLLSLAGRGKWTQKQYEDALKKAYRAYYRHFMDGGTMPKDKTKLLQLLNKAGSTGSKSTTIYKLQTIVWDNLQTLELIKRLEIIK
tara:strand:+ start:286 stop:1335 length:1050 start_codon:yes stop_codon:yes gene_type:complete